MDHSIIRLQVPFAALQRNIEFHPSRFTGDFIKRFEFTPQAYNLATF